MTAEHSVATIEQFVAATTSDTVAAAFTGSADKTSESSPANDTFADAAKLVNPVAQAESAATAMADFAFPTLAAPKAKFTVDIDPAKVALKNDSAAVPVAAITVKADGKKVSNNAVLIAHINDAVSTDGAWAVAFPRADAAAVTTAPASTPSSSGK